MSLVGPFQFRIFGVSLWFSLLKHQFLFSKVKGAIARLCPYVGLAQFSRAMQPFSKVTQCFLCPGHASHSRLHPTPALLEKLAWQFAVTIGRVNTPASKSAWCDFVSTDCSLLFNNLWMFLQTSDCVPKLL